ncbi:nitroreductase family protein [Reichenbachiella sp. MALMAid0571]|uniref:nitroreductase family protein n=1 Tax=Reichenbachiella sp. MALMAid0571 TaxID=3143939 RepID=UPI0032E026E4
MKTKRINQHTHVLYNTPQYTDNEIIEKSIGFYQWLETRRTVRDISSESIPCEVIENIVMSASTAPSGAHKQPWTFCVVSDSEIKKEIREAAEKEEYESYNGRMSDRWKGDLAPIGTDWKKPFLEEAPYLIVAFKRVYEIDEEGKKHNNYYVNESVGIACGLLIAAIHNAGLVTVTHTPSPMNFLQRILKRPENERPFLLLPVGKSKGEVYVPNLKRKEKEEVIKFY